MALLFLHRGYYIRPAKGSLTGALDDLASAAGLAPIPIEEIFATPVE